MIRYGYKMIRKSTLAEVTTFGFYTVRSMEKINQEVINLIFMMEDWDSDKLGLFNIEILRLDNLETVWEFDNEWKQMTDAGKRVKELEYLQAVAIYEKIKLYPNSWLCVFNRDEDREFELTVRAKNILNKGGFRSGLKYYLSDILKVKHITRRVVIEYIREGIITVEEDHFSVSNLYNTKYL